MNFSKSIMTILIGLCALFGIGGVIIAGMIIYTRATDVPAPPVSTHQMSPVSSSHTFPH